MKKVNIILIALVLLVVGGGYYFYKKGSATAPEAIDKAADASGDGSGGQTEPDPGGSIKKPSEMTSDEKKREQHKAFLTGGLSIIGRGFGINW